MPSRNRRRRNRHRRDPTPKCDIFGCTQPKKMSLTMPCCKKEVCGACIINVLKASYHKCSHHTGFALGYYCPFCRTPNCFDRDCNWIAGEDSQMKALLDLYGVREREFNFVPLRGFQNGDSLQERLGNLRMKSIPCEHGCHGCMHSKLEVNFVVTAAMASLTLDDLIAAEDSDSEPSEEDKHPEPPPQRQEEDNRPPDGWNLARSYRPGRS